MDYGRRGGRKEAKSKIQTHKHTKKTVLELKSIQIVAPTGVRERAASDVYKRHAVRSRTRCVVLAARLSRLASTFILSINDVPAIREIFGDFAMLEVQTKYTIQGGEAKNVGELLISNSEGALVGAQKTLI